MNSNKVPDPYLSIKNITLYAFWEILYGFIKLLHHLLHFGLVPKLISIPVGDKMLSYKKEKTTREQHNCHDIGMQHFRCHLYIQ